MSKKIRVKRIKTPIDLEVAMGLARGQVESLSPRENGELEISFADSVNWPEPALVNRLEKALVGTFEMQA